MRSFAIFLVEKNFLILRTAGSGEFRIQSLEFGARAKISAKVSIRRLDIRLGRQKCANTNELSGRFQSERLVLATGWTAQAAIATLGLKESFGW